MNDNLSQRIISQKAKWCCNAIVLLFLEYNYKPCAHSEYRTYWLNGNILSIAPLYEDDDHTGYKPTTQKDRGKERKKKRLALSQMETYILSYTPPILTSNGSVSFCNTGTSLCVFPLPSLASNKLRKELSLAITLKLRFYLHGIPRSSRNRWCSESYIENISIHLIIQNINLLSYCLLHNISFQIKSKRKSIHNTSSSLVLFL